MSAPLSNTTPSATDTKLSPPQPSELSLANVSPAGAEIRSALTPQGACLNALRAGISPILLPLLPLDQTPPATQDATTIRDTLQYRMRPAINIYDLSKAGVTSENVFSLDTPEARAFRRFALHNKRVWNRLRYSGQSAPIETLSYLTDLVSKPGTIYIEVTATRGNVPPATSPRSSDVLACGLVVNNPASPTTRGLALFNTQSASSYLFPDGFLVDLLIDKALSISGKKPMLTHIVEKPEKYAYRWSQRALEKRGFQPTAETIHEQVSLPAITGIRAEEEQFELVSRVYKYQPGETTARQREAETHKRETRRWVKERISAGLHFPPAYSRLAIWSVNRADNEAHLFAEQQSENTVVAFELDPKPKHFYRHNIEYRAGSSDGKAFPASTLDGIFLLNMLPDISMRGAKTTAEDNILTFLRNQAEQLRLGGKLLVRDFVVPDWPEQVVVKVSEFDGGKGGGTSTISSADFLRLYHETAYRGRGMAMSELPKSEEGSASFVMSRAEALKVALLNGYRRTEDISRMIDLPIGLMTQENFLRLGRSALNCRVLSSRPVYTPWVQDNILGRSKISFHNLDGSELQRPPNQFEMVLQKNSPGQGVAVVEHMGAIISKPRYLTHSFYQRGQEIREFVSRKDSRVYDLFPYFFAGDHAWILAKEQYPRGVPQAMLGKFSQDGTPRDFTLSGTIGSGYVCESIAVVRRKGESLSTVLRKGFLERAHLLPKDIPQAKVLRELPQNPLLPSPSVIDEIRWQVPLEIGPLSHSQIPERNYSGLSTSGIVRPFHVGELLSSSSTGPAVSVALGNMAYELCLRHKLPIPAWGGQPITLADQRDGVAKIHSAAKLFGADTTREKSRWRKIGSPPKQYDPFFEIWAGTFGEMTPEGTPLAGDDGSPLQIELEYAVPKRFTNNTISVCACVRQGGRILIGFQKADDLPLAQFTLQREALPCVYTFRVPPHITPRTMEGANAFLRDAFAKYTGGQYLNIWDLGPELQISSGVIPERLYPKLVELDVHQAAKSGLVFCDLEDLINNRQLIRCSITLTTLLRAMHALRG